MGKAHIKKIMSHQIRVNYAGLMGHLRKVYPFKSLGLHVTKQIFSYHLLFCFPLKSVTILKPSFPLANHYRSQHMLYSISDVSSSIPCATILKPSFSLFFLAKSSNLLPIPFARSD